MSLVAIIFLQQIAWVVHGIAVFHHWFISELRNLFAFGKWSHLILAWIVLIVVPVIIAAIPAFIYWLIKRRWMPYYMQIVWTVWLVLLAILSYQ
ncbi:MAG: hypothetical protein HWD59_00255 [Coxiellaceae bacterium]|nr:MAG: hypothetical protein HWD59_00255 [Coxiellaceae bacterium]